jgi:hypothetical protein
VGLGIIEHHLPNQAALELQRQEDQRANLFALENGAVSGQAGIFEGIGDDDRPRVARPGRPREP